MVMPVAPQPVPTGFGTSLSSAAFCAILVHIRLYQFLYYTGSTSAEVVAAQVANVRHPQRPRFQDFGDMMLRGNAGFGYVRLDWFTPDGLGSGVTAVCLSSVPMGISRYESTTTWPSAVAATTYSSSMASRPVTSIARMARCPSDANSWLTSLIVRMSRRIRRSAYWQRSCRSKRSKMRSAARRISRAVRRQVGRPVIRSSTEQSALPEHALPPLSHLACRGFRRCRSRRIPLRGRSAYWMAIFRLPLEVG